MNYRYYNDSMAVRLMAIMNCKKSRKNIRYDNISSVGTYKRHYIPSFGKSTKEVNNFTTKYTNELLLL